MSAIYNNSSLITAFSGHLDERLCFDEGRYCTGNGMSILTFLFKLANSVYSRNTGIAERVGNIAKMARGQNL